MNAPNLTPHLDAIRAGNWAPSKELAAYLEAPTQVVLVRLAPPNTAGTGKLTGAVPATPVVVGKERMEIAVCAGCGKVRYKQVGRLCGHAGTCEEQGRLF